MSDNQDQFYLAPQIDEPANSFKVVHLCNQSKTYHLTRQVLLDSALTQDTYCFFYHILTMTIDEFNSMYESSACLIERSMIEADIYLNVDDDALSHIVKYVQTGKIDGKSLYNKNWKTIDKIIDLATMFGMPRLVTDLRNIQPSDSEIEKQLAYIECILTTLIYTFGSYMGNTDNVEMQCDIIKKFMKENRELIIDNFIRPLTHTENTMPNMLFTLLVNLAMPLITDYISKKLAPPEKTTIPKPSIAVPMARRVPVSRMNEQMNGQMNEQMNEQVMRNYNNNFMPQHIFTNDVRMTPMGSSTNYTSPPNTQYCQPTYCCPTPVYPNVFQNRNNSMGNIQLEKIASELRDNLRHQLNPTNNYSNKQSTTCCNNSYPYVYYCRIPTEPINPEKTATEDFLNCLKEEIKIDEPVINNVNHVRLDDKVLKCITLDEMESLLSKYTKSNKCSFLCPSDLLKIFKSTAAGINNTPKTDTENNSNKTDSDTEFEIDSEIDTGSSAETESEFETESESASESESESETEFSYEENELEMNNENMENGEYVSLLKENITQALKKMVKSEVDVTSFNIDLKNNNFTLESLTTELKNAITNSLKNLVDNTQDSAKNISQ